MGNQKLKNSLVQEVSGLRDRVKDCSPLLLSVENLCVRVKDPEKPKEILKDISFTLHKAEVLAITGETGSGKTMTAKAIMGMLGPGLTAEGKIVLDGQSLLDLDPEEMQKLRGKKMGMAFQNPETALNPLLKNKSQLNLIMGKGRERQSKRLHLFGLKDKRIFKQYPFELSGGMAQRFMTSLALGHGVELVIFDEPSRGLDYINKGLLAEMISLLSRQQNVAILLLTHDMELVEKVADNCLVIQGGELVEFGKAATVLAQPKSAYMQALKASDIRYKSLLRDKERAKKEHSRQAPLLEIRGLNCSYALGFMGRGRQQVLKDLNLSLFPGEILGLMGESGCGKSTLASCILGNLPYQGEIYFNNSLLKKNSNRTSMGLICQSATSSFDPARTIGQSLREVFLIHPEYAGAGGQEEAIYEMLKVVEMDKLFERLDSYPQEFSGGQLQRFAIARTLLSQVKFLILDEVTSMLDLVTQDSIIRLLDQLREKRGLTYLFITHDLPLAKYFCDRILLMQNGILEAFI